MHILALRSYGDYVILLNSIKHAGLKENITIVVSNHLKPLHEALNPNFSKNFEFIFKDFGSSKQMIAFLLPNESNDASLNSFITTVDKIEQLTGIDFFASLPNQTEELLESTIVTSNWSW